MKRKLIGHLPVDSGQLMIVDPCYLDDWNGEYKKQEKTDKLNYASACAASKRGAGMLGPDSAACIQSGSGDGYYPVYVEFGKDEIFGDERPRRIVVDFYPEEEEDED